MTLANPLRAGVTVAELRLLSKVDATADHLLPAAPRAAQPLAGQRGVRRDSHEHPLTA